MTKLLARHWVLLFLCVWCGSTPVRAEAPPQERLVLWLDAADAESMRKDGVSRISQWRDKSPKGHHAEAEGIGPTLLNEQPPMVRFALDGKPTLLRTPKLRDATGPVTVFVVARRTAEQASEKKWQRLISAAESGKNDNEGNGLAMSMPPRGSAEAFEFAIYSTSKMDVAGLPVVIGGLASENKSVGMQADVAELLIYDHAFRNPADFEAVQDYLVRKWSVDAARDVGGWTHRGPVPATPSHNNPALPLIDQANVGNWQVYDAMTDEFAGDALDAVKWWDHNPLWHGRIPGRFLPENVRVRDGELQLMVKKDPTLPSVTFYEGQTRRYEDYSASSVVSKTAVTYGCFEVRVKVANTTCTSSWWFIGSAQKESESGGKPIVRGNELDVFELPAGCPGHEKRFGMNMHVSKEPETDRHWANWANWEAPFVWHEGYHTINFVWSPEWIRSFVDGHCIRTTRNVAWHVPERMIFDMEFMGWLPFPKDQEFPATYRIDYVRAWSRPDWKGSGEWVSKPDPSKATKITEIVRELNAERREQGLIEP